MDGLNGKYEELKCWLKDHSPLALAFSGGVDSSFLLDACAQAQADFVAVTVDSVFMSENEREEAFELAHNMVWLRIPVDVLSVDDVCNNPPDRCYYCKREIFTQIKRRVGQRTIIDGSNFDDLGDFRPGMRALKEMGVASPLIEMKWTKVEIREMSRRRGLNTADKPAMACLATRIPQGERIEVGTLRAIDMAENKLRHMGFKQVRVRVHGKIARIELEKTMLVKAAGQADEIVAAIKAAGFRRAVLDMEGYSMGSMNEREVSAK